MGRYVFKRILLALVSIFIICLITFFAMNAIPGGPFNSEKALSAATKAALEARYNLDKPVHIQFILYMRNLLHGDFGVSLKTGREISTTLSSCFKVSARLGLTAAVFAIIFGIILGAPVLVLVGLAPKSDLLCWVTLGLAAAYMGLLVLLIMKLHRKK